MEVGEAVGDNEEVVVGQVVKVGACDGRQHDTGAVEELAHGSAGEMGLVGEVEGVGWSGRVLGRRRRGCGGGGRGVGIGCWGSGSRAGRVGGMRWKRGRGWCGADEEALVHQGAGLEVAVVVEAAEDGLPAIFRQIFPRPPRPRHLRPQSFHGVNVKSVLTEAA